MHDEYDLSRRKVFHIPEGDDSELTWPPSTGEEYLRISNKESKKYPDYFNSRNHVDSTFEEKETFSAPSICMENALMILEWLIETRENIKTYSRQENTLSAHTILKILKRSSLIEKELYNNWESFSDLIAKNVFCLNKKLLMKLIRAHTNALPENLVRKRDFICLWAYLILLDTPLVSDDLHSIRLLCKKCKLIKETLGPKDADIIATIDMITVMVALIFGQKDLL